MSNSTFELFKSNANNQFYFRLKAGNGKIILRSEGYTTKQSCENGIESVKKNAPNEQRYERKQNGASYTFNLKAGNGEIVGSSESYTTSEARDHGIETVKQEAPDAPVKEVV